MIPKIFTTLSRDVTRYVSTLAVAALMIALAPQKAFALSDKTQFEAQVALAKAAVDAAIVRSNGFDVFIGDTWCIQATFDELNGAYLAAVAIVNGPDLSDYDAPLLALSTVIQQYNLYGNIMPGLKYKYAALDAAILAAKTAMSDIKISVTGIDVSGSSRWVTQPTADAFQQFIDVAESLKASYGVHADNASQATTRQGNIDNQVIPLTNATNNYTSNLNTSSGFMPDYSALQTLVDTAKIMLNGTHSAADGSNLPATGYWALPGDIATLLSAINTAENHIVSNDLAQVGNLTAGQNDVDAEEITLKTVFTNFRDNLRQNGGDAAMYDYQPMNVALAAADDALNLAPASNCGGNNVLPTALWSTPTAVSALQGYMAAAQAAKDSYGLRELSNIANVPTNQATIDSKVKDLVDYTATFLSSVSNGFKPDYTALQAQIDASKPLLSTAVSVDGHEVAIGTDWVTAADKTTFQAAITSAEGYLVNCAVALGDALLNQAVIDSVELALATADSDFQNAFHNGDQPSAADFANLSSLIQPAQTLLSTATGAASGLDVPSGTNWVTTAVYQALNDAIVDAQAIVNANVGTLTSITNAKNALNAATTAFVPTNGSGANPAVLNEEITAAAALLARLKSQPDSIAVSPNGLGTDILYGTPFVPAADTVTLRTAYDNAVNALSAAPPTPHTTITSLESVLQAAISNFTNAIKMTPDGAFANYDSLAVLIEKAKADTVGVKVSSNNGAEFSASVKWVDPSYMIALTTALVAAEAELLSPSYTTHAQLVTGCIPLNAALHDFNMNQNPGAMPVYFTFTADTMPSSFVSASYTLAVTNTPQGSVTWSEVGLPNGLILDPASGVISGRVLEADTFNFSITATQIGVGLGSDTKQFTMIVYAAPIIEVKDTVPGFASDTLVDVTTDIVIWFPIKMNTAIAGTVKVPFHQITGYWTSDTTYVIPHPNPCYEYEWNYSVAVSGLKSADGFLTYDKTYLFKTPVAPPLPNITRIVMFENLDEGIDSLVMSTVAAIDANAFRITSGEDFVFSLNVLPDKSEYAPEVLTNRTIDGAAEVLTGVKDATIANRYNFVVRAIHQHIRIAVSLVLNSSNQFVGQSSVWASDGKLNVSTQQPGQLSVYAITGELVVQTNISDSATITLPRGVYIVRLHGKAYKVVL